MITLLAVTAMLTGMVGSWLYARAALRAAHWFSIVTCACYAILNVYVAIQDPSKAGMLFLIVPASWGIGCSILGLRRLNP